MILMLHIDNNLYYGRSFNILLMVMNDDGIIECRRDLFSFGIYIYIYIYIFDSQTSTAFV